MFIWLTTLLSILALPFAFIFGIRPVLRIAGHWLTPEMRRRFPLSSRTPVLMFVPRNWLSQRMRKSGVRGYAFLAFVFIRVQDEQVLQHECVHVVHQSVISSVLYALVYLLDWLVYFPFRHWFYEGAYRRIPVGERVAYTLAGQDKSLAREDGE